MAESWLRACRVTVGQAGQLGRSFTEEWALSFSVQKGRSGDPNTASISIINLPLDDRRYLARADSVVTLEAGHQGHTFLLFSGEIERCVSERRGTDWITNLEAEDGGRLLNDEWLTVARGPGVTPLQLLEELARSVGAPVRIIEPTGSTHRQPYLYGYSDHGPMRHVLRRLAEAAGFEVRIEHGAIIAMPVDGETFDPAPLISVSTGLLDSPQAAQIERSHRRRGSRAGRRRTVPGVTFRCLLNTPLDPGQPFELEAEDAEELSGAYVVHAVDYSGDTRSQPWYAEVEAIERGANAAR